MIVIATAQLADLLDVGSIQGYLQTCSYLLFQNNLTPVPGTLLAGFTQSTFAGYTAGGIATPTWTAPVIVGAAGVVTSAIVTWTGTGAAQNIYGYYVVDIAGNLVFSERYAGAPFSISTGISFFVSPYFSAITQ